MNNNEKPVKDGSLLEHLLYYGHDPQDYIDALEELEELPRIKEQAEINPEGWDMEQISWIDGDIESDEEMISFMLRDWKPKGKPNMESEIAIIKKWLE